ncbi:hypothetical protein DER45DRAFT_551948 [Fusarium avenaceum]|nr:hypothetical protein DER45DRAFT_551948 [Fusarium avenaceum]
MPDTNLNILLERPDLIDMDTFSQITEMDDDGDREFSSALCTSWIKQVEEGFEELDQAIANAEFDKISSYSHHLHGLSEPLGTIKVISTFKDLQRLGNREDPTGSGKLDNETALLKAAYLMQEGKEYYKQTETIIRKALGMDTDGY